VIAPRKIRSSDGALEEHIAHLRQLARRMMKYHMPRRMPRAMQDIKLDLTEGHLVTILEPTVRRKALHRRKAEHLALLRHAVDPEAVLLMRTFDRHTRLLGQGGDGTGMVDMAMGDENLGQRQPFRRQRLLDAPDIAAGIDNGRLTGALAPKNGAILFEGCHRDDLVAHCEYQEI